MKATIDFWKTQKLFTENVDVYNKLFEMEEKFFISKPRIKWTIGEDGKPKNDGYEQFSFYINDFEKINRDIIKYCEFEPVELLEMMSGARINTENVFEAAKRNQIMLPNNLMLSMKELCVEYDACTNSINDLLKEGWILIAILPQHNQKRPDYILGKKE